MNGNDLPQFATPWTDKLGNVWCVKLEEDGISCRLCLLSDGRWRELGVPAYLPFFPEHLLAGFGRTLPPVPTASLRHDFGGFTSACLEHPTPCLECRRCRKMIPAHERDGVCPTPKRVAKAVQRGDGVEVAAKGCDLYFRTAENPERWQRYNALAAEPQYVAAAHEAFLGAGDVLPGEEPS